MTRVPPHLNARNPSPPSSNVFFLSLFLSISLFRLRLQFVPDDLKDDKYWARRRKNNMAAKRSRDARRMKENQIALRAGFLEKEVSFSHDWKLEARNRSVNCRTYRCNQRVCESKSLRGAKIQDKSRTGIE